ncbi:hypothetical protein BKA66DRAFT_566381 [Pyrenochaeta sp. MPI-SDFR-AT-0127]|nr:hypothetical protein BKA66DRAFT_566381 [Pyrenochaeta sp. MPI-SDFR-AT-0127]
MASFGFSIGDILLVSDYAYTIYKSCKSAGDAFKTITSDVNSLRSLLLALNDEITNPNSSLRRLPQAQQDELTTRLQDCKFDLREVKHILRGLAGEDKHTHGPTTATSQWVNIGTLSRIENNTEVHLLSLLEIRAKLKEIHRDLLAGRRDASVLDDQDGAAAIEDELLGDDMTEVDVNVDVSHEVSEWLNRIRPEVSERIASVPCESDSVAVQRQIPSPTSSATTNSYRSTFVANTRANEDYDPNRELMTSFRVLFPLLLPQTAQSESSTSTPSHHSQPVPVNRPTSNNLSQAGSKAHIDHYEDLTSKKGNRQPSPRTTYSYEAHTGKWSHKEVYAFSSIPRYSVAIFVCIYVTKADFTEGMAVRVLRVRIKRRIAEAQKEDRFEDIIVRFKVKKVSTPEYGHRVVFKGLGNQTVRSSWTGSRTKTEAEDVILYLHPSG